MPNPARVAVLVAMVAGLAACGGAAGDAEDPQREAVEHAVDVYLDALARAYSTFDVSPLEGVASPNEIEAVKLMLRRLSMGGDRLEARLLGYEYEGLEVFRDVNATVRLVEIWDITRFDAFSGREKGRNPNSWQKTLLQLRRVEGTWIVIGRSILEQAAPDSTPAVVIAPDTTQQDGDGE